ncbi:HAD family hydrolase [Bacillus sp. 03113]|uniref:HAD family hydrolase n=1 Tax=Bacillus sp. 03113 TaxID=2578211 RepID=UPI00114340D9|nr:HAD family hydrolase [Bacillus sp. 03113]
MIILFDLDGTLTDPKVGITKSVQYALAKMGILVEDNEKLTPFIGPPLQQSFSEFYHFNEEEVQQAIVYYRERFKDKGLFENEVYPKIPKLLEKLKMQDHILVVATSKPTIFAEEILSYFKLDHFFQFIIGSNLDGTRSSKGEIIEFVLNSIQENKLEDVVMIGDRKYDIIGANQNGVPSIGVTYGYGTKEELEEVNPTYIVNSVEDLENILVQITK